MIKCKLINRDKPLHLSKITDDRYATIATQFYRDLYSKESNKDAFCVVRLDPMIIGDGDMDDRFR